jgi:hypothetical protein
MNRGIDGWSRRVPLLKAAVGFLENRFASDARPRPSRKLAERQPGIACADPVASAAGCSKAHEVRAGRQNGARWSMRSASAINWATRASGIGGRPPSRPWRSGEAGPSYAARLSAAVAVRAGFGGSRCTTAHKSRTFN